MRVLIVFIGCLLPHLAMAEVQILDKVVAIVDEDVILQSEFDQRMNQIKQQAQGRTMPPEDILQEQVMERLIVDSLQMQMADRGGVRISDEELNLAMARIAEQNSLTLPQFIQAIEADGIAYQDMRGQIRKEMAISRVQQGVMRGRIQITDQEITNFLQSEMGQNLIADEYKLSHILLPLNDTEDGEEIRRVQRQADTLIQRISNGESFHSLAIEYSAGQNALEGGDLGWRKAAALPTIFSGVAEEMALGEVRGPIRSGSGFHIIKLQDKRGADTEGQVAQTEVRHVLVQPSEIRTEEEARELAMTLREEVVGGRDFDEIAKLHSDDPGSALSGGDLGWNRAGSFVPEFEQMMNATAENEVSEVFRSTHGYHFLQVTGRRIQDFSDEFRRGIAANYLRNQKFDEELETWLREIREDAFVEVRI